MRSVVTTSELSRSFGAIQAVGGVNLQIEEAEMFGLVGPDGAGKTTTLRMLCGILPPSSGTATVLGFDVMKEVAQIKRRIGYLSQRFTLYGDLTVDENIEFFAEIHGVWDFGPRREELLQFTRLTPFRDRLAERLSGGMKQKLALACTLIHRPQVIFLDEPTTGVDPVSRRDFWRILQSLVHEGITIVMSTPYLDEAERCTRVALMNAGTVMHMAPPMTLKEQMPGDVLEIHTDHVREGFALLKSSGTVREVQAFGDRLNVIVENADREAQTITALLRAHNISVTGCREIAPSLENVFISLLTKSKYNEVLP